MSYPHGSIIVHSAATTIQLKQGPSGKNTWTFLARREQCLGSGDCVGWMTLESVCWVLTIQQLNCKNRLNPNLTKCKGLGK